MKIFLAAVLIIMGFPLLVNAASAKTLGDLIKEAQTKGEDCVSEGADVDHANIPAGLPGKTLEVIEKDSTDGALHDFTAFFRDGKAQHVVFTTIHNDSKSEDFLNLACDPSGKLKACYFAAGTRDAAGKPIPGSAKPTNLNPRDKKMTSSLRHELDFWLKGMYRKPAAAPAPNSDEKKTTK